jgi:hypothetical protein
MNRALKLSLLGAAIAGLAVGTVAYLRSRGGDRAELVDFDDLSDHVSDAAGSARESAQETVNDLKVAASEGLDS